MSIITYTHPLWARLKKIAQTKQAHILLCEGADERVLAAVDILSRENICRISLMGDPAIIADTAQKLKISLKHITIINPCSYPEQKKVAQYMYERRKTKGMTEAEAQEKSAHPLYAGFGLLALGNVQGVVGGAVETTAATVHAGFTCLSPGKGHRIVIGLFLVEAPFAARNGNDGGFVFADCGVTPDPSSRMLAQIAKEAAAAYQFYFSKQPVTALLSFSTLGSAAHEKIDQVKEAVLIIRKQFPNLVVDGELQLDAALIPDAASQKGAGNSLVAGRANVLVFPDLNAGNITYKAVERLGGARTIGPILWGLEKPASDLSRACSVDDIVYAVCAVSALT